MANVINATSTGNGGLITTGDDSGVLNIQTNETTAMSVDASQSVDFTNNIDAPNTFGFKNRLINGNMAIDQRNAGASVTGATSDPYTVDRWKSVASQNSKFTFQQNAGSVTPPTGFKYYLGATSSSAYSIGSGDLFTLEQRVEGYNVADLGWGAAGAATVILSFWVRSSLTGTFGGSMLNAASDRSYPFTYTISAANTWEQKTVTVAGDTSGTWQTTTSTGIRLCFGLGVGTTYSAAAGSWATGGYASATGATSVVGTNGATFYITGVQLEKGTQATSFDFRSYGTELALCQRYCYVVDSTNSSFMALGSASTSNTRMFCSVPFPATTRVKATGISYNGSVGNFFINGQNTNMTLTSLTFSSANLNNGLLLCDGASGNTVGQFGTLYNNTSGIRIEFTGMEL